MRYIVQCLVHIRFRRRNFYYYRVKSQRLTLSPSSSKWGLWWWVLQRLQHFHRDGKFCFLNGESWAGSQPNHQAMFPNISVTDLSPASPTEWQGMQTELGARNMQMNSLKLLQSDKLYGPRTPIIDSQLTEYPYIKPFWVHFTICTMTEMILSCWDSKDHRGQSEEWKSSSPVMGNAVSHTELLTRPWHIFQTILQKPDYYLFTGIIYSENTDSERLRNILKKSSK